MAFPDIPVFIVRDSHFKNASSSSKKSPLRETNSCSVWVPLTRPTQSNASSLNCEGDFYLLPLSQSLINCYFCIFWSLPCSKDDRDVLSPCSLTGQHLLFEAYFNFTSFNFISVSPSGNSPLWCTLRNSFGNAGWLFLRSHSPKQRLFKILFKPQVHTHEPHGWSKEATQNPHKLLVSERGKVMKCREGILKVGWSKPVWLLNYKDIRKRKIFGKNPSPCLRFATLETQQLQHF